MEPAKWSPGPGCLSRCKRAVTCEIRLVRRAVTLREGAPLESLGRRRAKSSIGPGGGGSPADVTLLFDSNVPRQSCSNPYVISIMGVDTTHENGAQNEPGPTS